MIGELLIVAGSIILAFVVWWFHIRRHALLDARIQNADPSLLTGPGVRTESAIQAPEGSVVLPYTVVSPETTVSQNRSDQM